MNPEKKEPLLLYAIHTPIIKENEDIVEITVKSMEKEGLTLENGDILVFAETPIGTAQGRTINLNDITKISDLAKKLAEKYDMDDKMVQIIIDEADSILGGVKGVLLTEKESILIANAGIDRSNSGGIDLVSLFPIDPMKTATLIRERLKKRYSVNKLGIIIADSRVQPIRRGTIGVAIAVSGFEPVENMIGQQDLFGRPLEITERAVADDLTSAAQFLMGEADERIPIVLIRNADVKFTEREISSKEVLISKERCLFMNVFKDLQDYKNPVYKKPGV